VRVDIPYTPRPLQDRIHELRRQHRFLVLVCHRRFGKTVLAVNELQRSALTCKLERPRTAYIGPTYRQAKATAWDYVQHYAQPFAEHGATVNQSELRVDYPVRFGAGQVRLYGADNPDSLRGLYLDDCAFDEYGLQTASIYTEVIAPALVDRGGAALFLGTPNGKNQFWEIAQHAQKKQREGDPDWCYAEFKASQTGLLDVGYLAQARAVMTADEYAQEFECSWEAAVKGAIFAKEMETARKEKRITQVRYDPGLPVDTDWDIGGWGGGDATAIWFSQSLRNGEVRLIDYFEASGESLQYYAKMLQDRGYTYGRHYGPHDLAVHEMDGRSRIAVAASFGIRFEYVPRVAVGTGQEVEEGIHAARLFFARCWFDEDKCKAGLEALMSYRRDYNDRLNEFKATPVHDWASHGADAFRGLAVRHKTPEVQQREIRERVALPVNFSWS
jgi:phage terminase large subunit